MTIRMMFALTIFALPVAAQLALPNQEGVAVGHIHLYVHDIEAQKSFWTELGGTLSHDRIEFPGIYVILKMQDPVGGSPGSVVDHIGFKVKDLSTSLAKWRAAGINIKTGAATGQTFLSAPEDIKVEITEDKSLATPVAMHHIHMFLPDPKGAQAWYVKYFGAVAGERSSGANRFETASVPGAEIAFTSKDKLLAPTKGRVLEHIGFEVKNIDQFVKMLQAAGIHTGEVGVHKGANSDLLAARLTDPWGTEIELTQGLRPVPQCAAEQQRSIGIKFEANADTCSDWPPATAKRDHVYRPVCVK